MAEWLLPAGVALLIGIVGSVYLYAIRVPREETAAGIAALSDMRWRDFIHLVLDAMQRRGFARVFDADAGGDESDIELQRDDQRWLLSCKHGAAFVLGGNSIAALANAIRMRGATGGLLVTPGRFAPEANALATPQRIELLDGPRLWPELRPLLDESQRTAIGAQSRARAMRHLLLTWLLALFAGIVAWQLHDHSGPAASVPSAPSAAAPSTATQAPAPAAPSRRQTDATDDAGPVPADPAALHRRRQQAARDIDAVPQVQRALWSTESTLLVYLQRDQPDPKPALCRILERYDELAASRIQLQPPDGSGKAVRFIQCRAY